MTETILALLIAIRAVESSNGLDPRAHGNDYQITRTCVEDVNRIYHTRYNWPQCAKSREDAENIVVLYLSYYGMLEFNRTGRIPSTEALARIYNCGYKGYKRGDKKGHAYWRKIKTVIGDGNK